MARNTRATERQSQQAEKEQKPPLGTGHAAAFVRQGFAEIRSALYPDSNVAQRSAEMGIYGTATPSEISDEKDPDKKERERAARDRRDDVLNRHNYGPSTPIDREPPAIEPD